MLETLFSTLKRDEKTKEPVFSIIIPCKNEGENIRNTIDSIKENTDKDSYEIIVVDDGSDDGCCDFLRNCPEEGVTLVNPGERTGQARHIGTENAKGNIYVFCDAHIFVENDWLEKLAETLATPGINAVSPVFRNLDNEGLTWAGLTYRKNMKMGWLPNPGTLVPVPVLPRGCLAITRETFDAVGRFDKGFRMYAYGNVEFTMKLWLSGLGAYIDPRVTVRHILRDHISYPQNYVDIHYNLLRMAFLHFNQSRLNKIISQIKHKDYFPEIFTDVILSDALEQRNQHFANRVNDDDWFMNKFNIQL